MCSSEDLVITRTIVCSSEDLVITRTIVWLSEELRAERKGEGRDQSMWHGKIVRLELLSIFGTLRVSLKAWSILLSSDTEGSCG